MLSRSTSFSLSQKRETFTKTSGKVKMENIRDVQYHQINLETTSCMAVGSAHYLPFLHSPAVHFNTQKYLFLGLKR